MARHKVRFVVTYNGRQRQILSAEELKDGTVLIGPRLGRTLTVRPNEPPREILGEHISVHWSARSSGNLIKHSTRLKDGGTVVQTTFVKNTDEFLFAPVMYCRCGRLDDPTYDPKTSQGTVLTMAPAFSRGHLCCLVWVLVVAKPSYPFGPAYGYTVTSHRFSRFSIAVYAAFLNLPAITPTMTYVPGTSPPLIDGEARYERFSDGMESLQPGNLPAEILENSYKLGLNMVRVIESLGVPEILMSQLMHQPLWFTKDPPVEMRKQGEAELRALLDALVP